MRESINSEEKEPTFAELSNGENGLKSYEDYLGFNGDDLNGKTVLDVGSGLTERFSREIKEAGINANVISLSPGNSSERIRKIKKSSDWQEKSVGAIAQELPFKDESFDNVFGLYSITTIFSPKMSPKGAQKWISETARVLKPGGEARLAPVGEFAGDEEVRLYDDLLSDLEKQGLKCTIERVALRDGVFFRLVIKKPK